MNVRTSGILMHLTSLPGPHGIGDLGPEAYRFARFLSAAGQGIWQILPLNPTDAAGSYSPYHALSAFAGNPLLISPEVLVEEGWLDAAEIIPPAPMPSERVDFRAAEAHKRRLLESAFTRFESLRQALPDFDFFCASNAGWLDDYALFMTLKSHFSGLAWNQWPSQLRDREPDALKGIRHQLSRSLREQQFWQYLFIKQWRRLKRFCNHLNIRIFGDLPIYMPLESVDVWANPHQYKLDDERRPTALSGVPPDYFSSTGQLWGHPVYHWDVLRKSGYGWWMERLRRNFELVDILRIDHFRGLVAFWEVAAGARDAIQGQWIGVPTEDFFGRIFKRFGSLPLVAEDLGTIGADVREVMRRFDLPGMRVLQFAFGDDFPGSDYLPHRHERTCVVYTGTHDNNTLRGWFDNELDDRGRRRLFNYLGRRVPSGEIHREIIRLAMLSVANTAILPLQDVIGMGAEGRMNHPADQGNNWSWRLSPGQLTTGIGQWLRAMTIVSQRH